MDRRDFTVEPEKIVSIGLRGELLGVLDGLLERFRHDGQRGENVVEVIGEIKFGEESKKEKSCWGVC